MNLKPRSKILFLILPASFADLIQGDIDKARNTAQTIACHNKCWNGLNCDHYDCRGCSFSCRSDECSIPPKTCVYWCLLKSDCVFQRCKGCLFCNNKIEEATKSCPIATFEDKTNIVFSTSKNYWKSWMHSGRPYFHDGAPLFVDIDGDQILDYFNPMHGHPFGNIETRMELALSEESMTTKDINSLTQISRRIIIEEDVKIDAHGHVMADLDGDGYLDILISNGGGEGIINSWDDQSYYDNLLLWGEPSVDKTTGQKFTVFRGGKGAARKAGLEMRIGRGRYMFVHDANGDGLLDLFSAQDRVVSNEIVPGIMLFNQGDRTWKGDSGMREFTRAIILTDANGDGYADEILLNRGFCYPKRQDPGIDNSYPNLGAFTDSVKRFCGSRPAGTTAVYRFNESRKQMQEISKSYSNFSAANNKQPPCCPHGLYDSENDCAAEGIVSADLDGDQKADHIYLYRSKMTFFFSTDREEGELLVQSKHEGLEIKFPAYCNEALSVRVVDFDNDGNEEIFVTCVNAGIFLLYTNGSSKYDWSLSDECNEMGSLGDINNRFQASPTFSDLKEFCNDEVTSNWKTANKVCEVYRRVGITPAAKASGVSIVDLNNDGFLDIVVVHSFGYLRFFYNIPSHAKSTNKHIIFDLSGNGLIKNNGLGITFILYCTDNNGKVVKQFREISRYPLGTDMAGATESRLIFGLGKKMSPKKLLLRFSDTTKREIDLSTWKFSEEIMNLNVFFNEEEKNNPSKTIPSISPTMKGPNPIIDVFVAKSESCGQFDTRNSISYMVIALIGVLWW
jgi:hypothetical protein